MSDAVREAKARWARKQSEAVADIGDIPAVVNPERRASCERDLLRFLTTYFPATTGQKPLSEDHERMIGRIQACILIGALFANAFPRGFAKTTISENSAIWAVVYGHRKFVPVFGADAGAAASIIDSIKTELSENDLLMEDFPEVCHPVRALEGKVQRSHSQTHAGALTHIEWRADEIVLPTIPGSAASGAILTARGITGASRGMKHKRSDGVQQRPDFVILDDPQTDESASTPLQVKKRLDIVHKTILKLSGHSKKIAAVMNATVIKPDDMIEQILDPKKHPAWQGERVKMVRKWADAHETLWLGDYARLRNTYDADTLGDQQRAHREATEFYKLNRERMDAGCDVSWQHCYDESVELSAIQHAYNALIDDGEEVFASEYQNEPIKQKIDDDGLSIAADDVCAKVNGMDRGRVPVEVSCIVAFIDPKKELLPWGVMGFADGFSGFMLDYGAFPDQKRTYFSTSKPKIGLQKTMKSQSWEAGLYAGLDALVGQLAGREWKRDDGAVMKLERIVIDANWGEATETIYQFCRQSPQAAILLPSHGKFVGATSRPFGDYRPQPGDRAGTNWRMPVVGNRRAVRYIIFDANWWKAFSISRLRTPMGGRGCMSLFGRDPQSHRMLADHVVSEKPVAVEAKGRRVIEFKQPPGVDNDFFDIVVGCHVGASERGVTLHDRVVAERKRVTYAEKMKTRKVWGANR